MDNKMKNRILELAYDKLMDNYQEGDIFNIEAVEEQEIDFLAGTIKFNYTIGGIVYPINLKLF